MLATNIAGLVSQSSKGGLGPKSLQQLYNTYIFIKVVSIGGFLPITFTLFTLHMLGKRSWFLWMLSAASIAVGVADLYIKREFIPSPTDLDSLSTLYSSLGGSPSCGQYNPAVWCYDRISSGYNSFNATNTADGADDILIVSLVAFALLTIDQFFHSEDATNVKTRNYLFHSRTHSQSKVTNTDDQSPTPPSTKKVIKSHRFLRFGIPVLRLIFFILYLYCFATFAYDLNGFRENAIYDSAWGFGQIVAVLVWAPPLLEYGHVLICKLSLLAFHFFVHLSVVYGHGDGD